MGEWMYGSTFFLTSALVRGERSASRPDRFTPEEKAPGTHWKGGWVNPRAGLDHVEKRKFLILPGLELRPPGQPARSQSLYRLCYPGSSQFEYHNNIAKQYKLWRSSICNCLHSPGTSSLEDPDAFLRTQHTNTVPCFPFKARY
jgi:hypothetical protein